MEDFQSDSAGKVLSHILGQGTCFTVKDGIVTVAPNIGIY
jgi:hypothetical protein